MRGIHASPEVLHADATGEVEAGEDRVLVLRRIHVRFDLRAATAEREIAERVHRIFADHCPVYRSITPAVGITTELMFAK